METKDAQSVIHLLIAARPNARGSEVGVEPPAMHSGEELDGGADGDQRPPFLHRALWHIDPLGAQQKYLRSMVGGSSSTATSRLRT